MTLIFLLEVLPVLSTFLLVMAYLPQLIKTYKTKNVEGISLMFWVLMNLALTFMLINALVIFLQFGTFGYLIVETFNEGMALMMLIMVVRYRNKTD